MNKHKEVKSKKFKKKYCDFSHQMLNSGAQIIKP